MIPVIRAATGTISKSFTKYVRNVTGKHEIMEVQKQAILGTALRNVLVQKDERFNTGSSTICAMNRNCSIAKTLYSLKTWFVPGK
jgi:hypothetical protein